jgi:hypothetical protein
MRKNNPLFFDDFVGINNNKITARLPQVYPKFFMILSESLRGDYGEFEQIQNLYFVGVKI